MKPGSVTIKDIARILGISTSTVSRALKDHPDISPKTKKAVNELAKKLNYKPNAIALSLRSKQTRILGIIIPQIVHYFFSSVISGIEEVANKAGYHVMICQSNESYSREIDSLQALMSSKVDGLIISVAKETKDYDHLKSVIDDGTPTVFFDRRIEEIKSDYVVVDDFDGAYQATKHLLEQGCRRIAHLASSQHLLIGRNRLNGYRQALNEFNIEVDPELVIKCDTHEASLELTERLLKLEDRPDGIFAVNDHTAIGAITVIKRHQLRVPEDIAVVGFTNGQMATISDPPLTSVDQNGFEMGKQAAQMLLDRLSKEDIEYAFQSKVLKTSLIVRSSSKLD